MVLAPNGKQHQLLRDCGDVSTDYFKENFKKVICYFDFLGKNCSTTKRQGV
jgi:hypothetical protein